jgi:hypothetical protein
MSHELVYEAKATVRKKIGEPIMFPPCERDFLWKMAIPFDLGVKNRVRLGQQPIRISVAIYNFVAGSPTFGRTRR